ncbi:MAG TPA: proton-conducting transporter membrane subunit, partial [Bacteroidales bacterium]|nr:proton-conducting transporter membrane subunit [Bacteroidales bacterium]
MLVAVLSGFIAAIFAPQIHKSMGRGGKFMLALVPLGIFLYLTTYISDVARGEVFVTRHQWFPELGIHVGFMIDGLSLVFALLISGIGALVVIYGAGYLGNHPKQERFLAQILFFMVSMLGMVTADNIITIFIFWELTSISSYFLIGFNHEREAARKAALQALLVTGGGGLALLAGFLFLGLAGGSFTISELLTQGSIIKEHHFYPVILVMVFVGAFSKSAQFPFHFWLPNAMEAPTPVSAYLHSATMVKAGIYVLARLSPVLGETPLWQNTLLISGGFTMLLGAFQALGQTDLKRMLAYTTISALGMLVFLIGIGTHLAITAALTFLVAHALYKGSLFLIAGTIEHERKTRDLRFLSGMYRQMPLLAVAAFLAAFSYAGIFPFLGFFGKE